MRTLRMYLLTALAAAVVAAAPAPATAQDAVNLSQATIVGSPADIASWPATVRITHIDVTPGGINIEKAGPDWPDYTPPGWDGQIQYTVWACRVQAPPMPFGPPMGLMMDLSAFHSTCAGFVQMWRGRGPDALPSLPSNWSLWWGPQAGGAIHDPFGGYVPKPGDLIAFLLSSGNARGELNATSVRERSNVVVVTLPAGDNASFDFPIGATAPAPPSTSGPVEAAPAPASPAFDLHDVLVGLQEIKASIAALADDIADLKAQQTADDAATQNAIAQLRQDAATAGKSALDRVLQLLPLAGLAGLLKK